MTRQRFCLRLGMLVGQVALAGFPDISCVASSSPRAREGGEDPSAAKTEIPFQLYNGSLIIVKASIGTVKNLNMILDTGTSPSAISQELADRLKLRGKTESLQTLNGTIQTQSLILPGIQLGPMVVGPIRVVVQDLGFMERSLGISVAGIAGLDILSSRSFTIDYRKKRIVFGPIAASAKTVRFETQEPFLTVKAIIDRQAVRLLVDSGTWGLLVYRNRLQTNLQQVHFDSNASISSPGGTTRVRWLRAGVLLGKDDLGARKVAIADIDSDPQNDFDGLLGFAKMGFRRVSFDFENGLFGWE
jgi:Aspartyl protease